MVVEKYIIGSLLLIPTIILLFDSFLRGVYLFFFHSPIKKPSLSNHAYRLAFVIVVRNEAKIIKDTINKIWHELDTSQGNAVFVIVDHCSDHTEAEAENAGAIIYVRREGDFGKGYALAWFADKASKELKEFDAVIIMDADSTLGTGYYQSVCDELSCGYSAIQSYIKPVVPNESSPSLLAAYSELLSQEIDDRARVRLNWPVPIRGTGVVFRIPLFLSLAPFLCTQVEDIEMSIQLSMRNIPIKFASEAILLDPKVTNIDGLARQRGRWLKGQRQIWFNYFPNILKLFFRGPGEWSLIQSLLFKPKTGLLLSKSLIALAWWFMAVRFSTSFELAACWLVFAAIMIDVVYYIVGLFYVLEPKRYLLALLKSPVYLIVWARSLFYSLKSGQIWLRARKG